MAELIYKDEVFAVVGAAMEVHTVLGSGFLEAVYQEAMELELQDRGIPARPNLELRITYKGRRLKKHYVADFVCHEKIIVELKAIDHLTGVDESQLLKYLKATGFKVGILVNFGAHGKLEWKRMVL